MVREFSSSTILRYRRVKGMKFKVDTHTHTLASGHAYSTIREMAEMALEHGMEAIIFTEHAPMMPDTCGLYYFENLKILPRERWGIRTFFGAEVNILNNNGDIDMKEELLKKMDFVIASVHTPCYKSQKTVEAVTEGMIRAMQNPYVNAIGHPDDDRFPVDYEKLVKAAKETRTLLEVNNSSMRADNNRVNADKNIRKMLKYCKQYGVPITVGSDSHLDLDAGKLDLAERILKECDFPEELVVTTSLEKLKTFMNRYKNKKSLVLETNLC